MRLKLSLHGVIQELELHTFINMALIHFASMLKHFDKQEMIETLKVQTLLFMRILAYRNHGEQIIYSNMPH